jgi:hypothetical protein
MVGEWRWLGEPRPRVRPHQRGRRRAGETAADLLTFDSVDRQWPRSVTVGPRPCEAASRTLTCASPRHAASRHRLRPLGRAALDHVRRRRSPSIEAGDTGIRRGRDERGPLQRNMAMSVETAKLRAADAGWLNTYLSRGDWCSLDS